MPSSEKPWYTSVYVWLFVIGGPAIAAAASIYTIVLAERGAEPEIQGQATSAYADVSAKNIQHAGMLPADKARKMAADLGAHGFQAANPPIGKAAEESASAATASQGKSPRKTTEKTGQ